MPDDISQLQSALEGRYTIQRELGRGGMARVYLAQDHKHDRLVAIKVLRPEIAEAVGGDRFLREIRIAAQLSHPNILGLHDSGAAGSLLYYLMPYVEGESLRGRLLREKQLSIDDALAITQDVASALSYAHSREVVHRDIKPENILLIGGRAVVADFGIARAVSDVGGDTLTAAGLVVGTPAYMSPEQASGGDVDARSDEYSLACVVYEMLAGEPPFEADTPLGVIQQHLSSEPRPISSIRAATPPPLTAALECALAKTPADRFATVAQFAEALTRGTAPSALRAWGRSTRLVPRVVLPAGGGVALLAVVGGWFLLSSSPVVPFDARDWVLVADVENLTGDSIFDRSLDLALSAGVTQSDRINVFPRNRRAEVLQRMDRPADTTVMGELARELAQREGLKVVIASSIARIDDSYLLTVRLVDPATGQEVEAISETAAGRDEVLSTLGDLTRDVRRALGESRLDVMQNWVPLPRATTPSLVALKAFADGSRAWSAGQYPQAVELWSQALEEDSAFAWAHASLALYYSWFNDRPRAEEHHRRALAELDRLTEREALWIRSLIAGNRGNQTEALELLQTYVRRYPDDRDAWFNLGSGYMRLGRCEEATPALQRALEIDSTMASAHIQIATCLNRSDPQRAVESYHRAFAMDPGAATRGNLNHEYGQALVRLGFLDSAAATFRRMFGRAPADEARGRRSLALLYMYRGQFDAAVNELTRSVRLNQTAQQGLSEMRDRLFLAVAHQAAERDARFREELRTVERLRREIPMEPYWLMLVGKLHARAGDVTRASAALDAMAGMVNDANDNDRASQQLLEGEVLLARGEHGAAIERLELAATIQQNAYHRESLAHAYAVAGDVDAAVRTYETIVADTALGWEVQTPWLMSHYYLGRLHEARSEPQRAVEVYEALLRFWAEGDEDLPVLRDTRERVARLVAAEATG